MGSLEKAIKYGTEKAKKRVWKLTGESKTFQNNPEDWWKSLGDVNRPVIGTLGDWTERVQERRGERAVRLSSFRGEVPQSPKGTASNTVFEKQVPKNGK
ncbi:MAG TPA: hypothetical protein VE090_01590 [Methylomirabilota bacterium]|nr:hypothetical protein [Methylomirabilota bacterium]